MVVNLVCSVAQTLFSVVVSHVAHEFGVGELVESGIHELREVDLGGYEHQAAKALRSASHDVVGFIAEADKQLLDAVLHGFPAESR